MRGIYIGINLIKGEAAYESGAYASFIKPHSGIGFSGGDNLIDRSAMAIANRMDTIEYALFCNRGCGIRAGFYDR